MKKKSLSVIMFVIVLFAGAIVLMLTRFTVFFNESYYSEVLNHGMYIDFFGLDKNDVFDEATGLNMEILEDEYLLHWFMESRRIMQEQTSAIEAYSMITRNFIRHIDGRLQFFYPDNWAGGFIESNVLIIQLTDLNRNYLEFYLDRICLNAPVEFRRAEFSLNQLISFGEAFVNKLEESNFQVVSHDRDVRNNQYRIDLCAYDPLSEVFIYSFNVISGFLPVSIYISVGFPLRLD